MLKWLTHPGIVVLATILSVVFFMSLHKSGQKSANSAQTLSHQAEEIASLEEENQNYQQQLAESQSPLEQEKLIRDQLLMQKPGEYVVQIARSSENNQQTTPDIQQQTPWQAWKALLYE
jgi:hypothetical protein